MTREVQIALEWWRASGEQTQARLESLVRHFCRTYAHDEGFADAAVEESLQYIHSWELTE